MTETKKRATGKRVSGALIKNAVLLTVFSLACKGIGMLFRLYLSVRIGAEGMGLYQLVMSVSCCINSPKHSIVEQVLIICSNSELEEGTSTFR